MKRFTAMLVSALLVAAGAVHAGNADTGRESPETSTWLVLYDPGPAWIPDKPVTAQGLGDHFHWLLDLYSQGTMKFAGPFTDDTGGMLVLEAADAAAAEALLAGDPAVEAGIMQYELRPLLLQPWERHLQNRAKRLQQHAED